VNFCSLPYVQSDVSGIRGQAAGIGKLCGNALPPVGGHAHAASSFSPPCRV
jgi:hypothetical protein